MTQPSFVPQNPANSVRQGDALPPARASNDDRPGEVTSEEWPTGSQMGEQGPDQGYALRLARLFVDRIELPEGEHDEDVIAVLSAVALKRAARAGRGPIMNDIAIAFAAWGLQPKGPEDLAALRRKVFAGASHDYTKVRTIVDITDERALKLNVPELVERSSHWREYIHLADPQA